MRLKNKRKVGIFMILLIIVVLFVGLYMIEKGEKVTYAYQDIEIEEKDNKTITISNAQNIDLDSIIEKNSKSVGYTEEIIVEEEELEYITKYRNNPEIYRGKTEISQEGRNGVQAITTKKVYDENKKVIKEERMSAVVVKSSINKVIDIGTKKYVKPSKIIKDSNSTSGFNIALNKPSGLTLEQFTKVLTDSKDKNKIFEENAKYFYYIEDQYKINGIFVAAVGIHESAWGTSKISKNKKNLFGYGAYDSNPYNGAYSFETYSESIDLIARVFVKYYLNPKGTNIFDGQTAKGSYYSGNTLTAVNRRYASDKKWANNVYEHMRYLYSKI